jgi:hypothetical protein
LWEVAVVNVIQCQARQASFARCDIAGRMIKVGAGGIDAWSHTVKLNHAKGGLLDKEG